MLPHETTSTDKPVRRVYTVKEAAEQLAISRSHIYSLNKAGIVRFSKLLGRTVVTQAEIDRVVASLEHDAAQGDGEAA